MQFAIKILGDPVGQHKNTFQLEIFRFSQIFTVYVNCEPLAKPEI